MADKTKARQEGTAKRTAAGRFTPGASGNPAGRPRGARNRASLLCQELLDGSAEAITARLVGLAKRGDRAALRLVIERVLPVRRDRVVEALELPKIRKAEDLVQAASVVVAAAAAGQLSLEEARGFMALIEAERRAIETADLAVRIEALERAGVDDGGLRDELDRLLKG
ncbi:MAG TPA: DUF5681 domain-containing protein [Bryobacteraceae bacterium]|nr:DUF5681 domain-containing protein [Bryobacteraceae bacterium]